MSKNCCVSLHFSFCEWVWWAAKVFSSRAEKLLLTSRPGHSNRNGFRYLHNITANIIHENVDHRFNMELDLQSWFGLLCAAVLIGCGPAPPPSPPYLGSHTRALLVSQGWTTSLCKPLMWTVCLDTASAPGQLTVCQHRKYWMCNPPAPFQALLEWCNPCIKELYSDIIQYYFLSHLNHSLKTPGLLQKLLNTMLSTGTYGAGLISNYPNIWSTYCIVLYYSYMWSFWNIY